MISVPLRLDAGVCMRIYAVPRKLPLHDARDEFVRWVDEEEAHIRGVVGLACRAPRGARGQAAGDRSGNQPARLDRARRRQSHPDCSKRELTIAPLLAYALVHEESMAVAVFRIVPAVAG